MENRPSHFPGSGAPLAEGVAAKLTGRRRRVRAIRLRVAGLSLASLMATSGVVLVQMVTGNDPALAKTHPSRRAPVTRRHSSSRSQRAASTPTTVTTHTS